MTYQEQVDDALWRLRAYILEEGVPPEIIVPVFEDGLIVNGHVCAWVPPAPPRPLRH